jgi:hypothetical protein
MMARYADLTAGCRTMCEIVLLIACKALTEADTSLSNDLIMISFRGWTRPSLFWIGSVDIAEAEALRCLVNLWFHPIF